jgi:hypothetical protein
MSRKRSKDPADWHPNQNKAFNYEHIRASRLPHVIRFEKGFRHYIHWEERKDFVLIYLNTPMEDEFSESYMLHPKVRQWMNETVIDREDWTYNDLHSVIQFRHKHHAMMFKLSFPDGVVR